MTPVDWVFVLLAALALITFLALGYLRRQKGAYRLPRSFFVLVALLLVFFIAAYLSGDYLFIRLIYITLIIWAMIMMGGFGERRASAEEKHQNRDAYR